MQPSDQPFQLRSDQAMPGLRCKDDLDWCNIQFNMREGVSLTPSLPIGSDAAYIWIPKNGCTSLKMAWLNQFGSLSDQQGLDPVEAHRQALRHTYWLNRAELEAVAEHRQLLAIWRDPIERFVSACRSHLCQLTTAAIHQKFWSNVEGDQARFDQAFSAHHQLFLRHGIRSLADAADPAELMNQVALQLPAWIACHLDWSHHTLPQISFLGGDPGLYTTILGMEQIDVLIAHWQSRSGEILQQSRQHVSAEQPADAFRQLRREDLQPEALEALHRFYASDVAFIELAINRLGPWAP